MNLSDLRPGRVRRTVTVLAALAVGALPLVPAASADVTPATVEATLSPGESITVTKDVDVPEVPPTLDLALMVDLSGSYGDDLPTIKAKAPEIFDGVRDAVADSTFGLATFVDYPFSPWGNASTGDYAYQLDQDLTADKGTWTSAVDAMVVRFGGDGPESQYEAVFQAATGAGRDVPPAGASLGDVLAGQAVSFRADATKVIALTTDASFHVAGDSNCTSPSPPCPFGYPGPTAADATDALVDAGIKVIAIKAPGASLQMDDLAAATGGAVATTGSTSEQIVEAIVNALQELTFDVTAVPVGCDPLEVTFDPVVHEDVGGGTTVSFEETITVPLGITGDDLGPGGTLSCTVEFFADDTLIGTQTITITVVIPVEIDIKPGSDPNSINVRDDRGVIPVAILTTDTFDATTVDPDSVCFGDADAPAERDCTEAHGTGHPEDADGDGDTDLVLHFETQETGIDAGDTEACLTGTTVGGIPVEGCDSIRTVPAM